MVLPGTNLECQGRFLQPRNACTWGPRLVPWQKRNKRTGQHMWSSIEERKEDKERKQREIEMTPTDRDVA